MPVLLVSRAARLVAAAGAVVRELGHELTEASSAADATAWLRQNPAGVAMVDLDFKTGWPTDISDLLRSIKAQPAVKLLALVRAYDAAQLRRLFTIHRLRNFIAVSESDQVNSLELSATIAKLLGASLFGPQLYHHPNPAEWVAEVTKSEQRPAIAQSAEAFAIRMGFHTSVAEVVSTVADELITNALYNAPRDGAGNAPFARLPRAAPVALGRDEKVVLRLAHDRQRLCISVCDPYGSMTVERALDCLTRSFSMGREQVHFGSGGAGLGLYFIFNLVHHLVINIAPGRFTEAIGIIHLTRSFKEYKLLSRSLNVFVEERP